MLCGENAGAAVGSGEVDDEFWLLILQDEEWLAAEFNAIVSEPGETRARSSGRSSTIAAAPLDRLATPAIASGFRPAWRAGGLPGRRWRRERSPPPDSRAALTDALTQELH